MNTEYAKMLRECWDRILMCGNIEICTDKLKDCGILEVKILKYIYRNPDCMIKSISKALNVPNSTFSNAVNRLSSRDLLIREISNDDLRSYKLTLTADGKQAAAEHIAAEVKIFERLIDDFNEHDKSELLRLLDAVADKCTRT